MELTDWMKDWMTAREAAERLGITRQAVDAAIERGNLEIMWIGFMRMVKADSVAAYEVDQDRREIGLRRRVKVAQE